MKHHVIIVYQTVPPQGINNQICRNIAARKIYLDINIPRVSSTLKKFIVSENRNCFIHVYILYIGYNAYIEE